MNGLAVALVAAAVLFNPLLALMNAHVTGIGSGHVAAVQAALVAAAFTVALLRYEPTMLRWFGFAFAALLLFVLLSLGRQAVQLKYLADLVVIPAFVLLGWLATRRDAARLFAVLQCVIAAVALYEMLFPEGFGGLFGVRSYYIATRGFSEESFWNTGSELFVSAQRPDGRFLLPFLGDHRASSVFLEPVSLGNWTIVATLFLFVLRHDMTRRLFVTLAVLNAALLVASDGRLAVVVNLLLLMSLPFAHKIPRSGLLLYLPAVFVAAWALDAAVGLDDRGDNFVGRLAYGLHFIQALDLRALLGLSATGRLVGADSGLGYFIVTQSLPAALAVWAAIILMPPDDRDTRGLLHGVALYIALCLPVSYSLFSIKTVAPLWFLYGAVAAHANRLSSGTRAASSARSLRRGRSTSAAVMPLTRQ